MTWIRSQLASAPHLLDPDDTVKSSMAYYARESADTLERRIREQKRAIEHEQAILKGMELALEKTKRGR